MPEHHDDSAVPGLLAGDHASRLLGIVVDEYDAGWATARMTVRGDMVNGHGIAHGGLIFALADTTFAVACNAVATPTVAAGAEIVFVAPARIGDELVAEARVRTSYGRHGVYDVTVRNDDGVVAEFRGRSHTRVPRPRDGRE